VSPTVRIARKEIFGPLLSLLPVSSYEEAARIANSTDYGLSTAIFTNDAPITFRALHDIEADQA
jgi:alpha-ketoglutaric semialdehyde dehydrogenase